MTVTMTLAPPPFPLLTALLWVVSVAVSVRSNCLLVVFAVGRKTELAGRVHGSQAAAYGLTSAALFSVESWGFGAVFSAAAAVCAVLWRQNLGKRPTTAKGIS